MKPQKYIKKVLYVLSALCLLVFFSSSGFRDNIRTGGWYQQFFPNMNGCTITSLTFLDSLTGFAVTNVNSSLQGYILKTTNSGDNWIINYTYNPPSTTTYFTKVQFVNTQTGFASTNYYNFLKTTNAGINWIDLPNLPYGADDMAAINTDTVLIVSSLGFGGGVYRTTNGGLNWSPLGPTGGNGQPYTIYMFNKDIGFNLSSTGMKKTVNGGLNWILIPGETFSGIQMIDSLIGWKTYAGVKKTTNGGLNWISQQLPNLPHSWVTSKVFVQNKDTLWIVGDEASNAHIYKTINSGVNWGYQKVDTSIHITAYDFICFVTPKIGWANSSYYNSAIHTTSGGSDTTFYTGVKLVEEYVPMGYLLRQNYPNPFNPQTNIPFELSESGYVTLKVYDITGREVKELINGKWGKASYVAEFNSENLASGIYFYRLRFVSDATKKKIVDTKKMMLLK